MSAMLFAYGSHVSERAPPIPAATGSCPHIVRQCAISVRLSPITRYAGVLEREAIICWIASNRRCKYAHGTLAHVIVHLV